MNSEEFSALQPSILKLMSYSQASRETRG